MPHGFGRLIAVTGGIGSGKSLICRVLSVLGYDVYDCDSRAKALMDSSTSIKQQIFEKISTNTIIINNSWQNAVIDRYRLSEIVFADAQKLNVLNSIVHGAVIEDVSCWYTDIQQKSNIAFVESAVLFTSGLIDVVDEVWVVSADRDMCINRAMFRDNVSAQAVAARIASQEKEKQLLTTTHKPVSTIDNNGRVAVLPQVLRLIEQH